MYCVWKGKRFRGIFIFNAIFTKTHARKVRRMLGDSVHQINRRRSNRQNSLRASVHLRASSIAHDVRWHVRFPRFLLDFCHFLEIVHAHDHFHLPLVQPGLQLGRVLSSVERVEGGFAVQLHTTSLRCMNMPTAACAHCAAIFPVRMPKSCRTHNTCSKSDE